MSLEKFREEVRRVLSITDQTLKGKMITNETRIEGLDSLSITEICVLAEEELRVELDFAEVKNLKSYGELERIISEKVYP